MSMPSDVNPDVADAARAMDAAAPKLRQATSGVFRRVSKEQYGFAAAALVAFVGVAFCGPKLRELRKPRHRRMVDRVGQATERALRRAQRQTRDVQGEAGRRIGGLREALSKSR